MPTVVIRVVLIFGVLFRGVDIILGGKILQFVPGAELTMLAPSDESISLYTDARVGNETATYRRTIEMNQCDDYVVAVLFIGSHYFCGETVSADSVSEGRTVTDHVAHYSFEGGIGNMTADVVGRTDIQFVIVMWIRVSAGSPVKFESDESDHAELAVGPVWR